MEGNCKNIQSSLFKVVTADENLNFPKNKFVSATLKNAGLKTITLWGAYPLTAGSSITLGNSYQPVLFYRNDTIKVEFDSAETVFKLVVIVDKYI